MPGVSKAQVTAMRIAKHNPSKLYKRNASLLGMKMSDMEDFVHTDTSKLPMHVHVMISKMKKKKK